MPRSTTPPAPSSQVGPPAVRAVDTSTAGAGAGPDAAPAGPGTVLVSLPEWHSPLSVGLASLLSDQPGVHLVPSATISSSPQRGVLLRNFLTKVAAGEVPPPEEAIEPARGGAAQR